MCNLLSSCDSKAPLENVSKFCHFDLITIYRTNHYSVLFLSDTENKFVKCSENSLSARETAYLLLTSPLISAYWSKKNLSPGPRNQEIMNYGNKRTAFMVNSETSSPYLILMLITWYVQANSVQVTFATEFQISRKKSLSHIIRTT